VSPVRRGEATRPQGAPNRVDAACVAHSGPWGGQHRVGGDPLAGIGVRTPHGVEMMLIRWERDARGDWTLTEARGILAGKVRGGVRLLVDGAETVYTEDDGWAVCCA
jgi:hypothetical protein